MFPAAPNVDGLPTWLAVLVSLIFGLATIGAAVGGYRKRADREPGGAGNTVLASIPDMSAIRQLTDQSRILCQQIESLEASMRDHTHYLRNKIETDQELCQRLRELKEEIARSDRQHFGGPGR